MMKKVFYLLFYLCVETPIALANVNTEFGDIKGEYVGIDKADNVQILVDFILNEGWYSYFKIAGPYGVDATLSHNNTVIEAIYWPKPKLLGEKDIESVGYEDNFTLLLEIPMTDIQNDQIALKVDFGVCKNICIPLTKNLTIPVNSAFNLRKIEINMLKNNAFSWPDTCIHPTNNFDADKFYLHKNKEGEGFSKGNLTFDATPSSVAEIHEEGVTYLSCT